MKYSFFLKWLCLLLFLSIGVGVSASENADSEYDTTGDGSLSDSNIQFVGRWDKSNANYYQSHWLGAYVRVDFTGASIKINLEGNEKAWLVVQIDNEAPRTIYAGNGTELSAGNLKAGRHTIMVGASELINNKISFKGFTLGASDVTYKSKARPLIEFVGDSITAGGGTYPKDIYNYAWLVSDRLDCDHTQIAYPGLALCTGYTYYSGAIRNTNQAVGMDKLYFSMKDLVHFKDDNYTIKTPWNFSDYTPHIVLLFLGTNDSSNGALTPTDASPSLFKEKMGELFGKMRTQFPDAHLMCMLPFSGVYKNEIAAKIDELKNAGDERVYFINTDGWLSNPADFTDGIHLNAQGTAKAVDKLYEFLEPIVQEVKDEIGYVDPPIGEKFYLTPSEDWAAHDATFGAIFKNGTTEKKVSFSFNNQLGMYELSIPDGTWNEICMKRYAPDGVSDWGGFSTFDPVAEVHNNHFISYTGAFNSIEIIGWADGTNPMQYFLSKFKEDDVSGITIRFKKPDSWSVVNIHAWDAVGVALPGFEWPGNAMQVEANESGWYTYSFDPSVRSVSFQFNKGDADGLIVKEHVTEDTSYNADGTVSGVEQNFGSDLKFRVGYKQISISSEESVRLRLYSIKGYLMHDELIVGDRVYPIDSGIYLMSAKNRIYKLLVP